MAGIIALADDKINEICEQVTAEGDICVPANFNCPGQVVISGSIEGIDKACGLMKAAGINLFVIIFVEFMSSMVWTMPYMNPFAMATLQVAGGKYVTFKEMQKVSVAYMIINLIGCLASIPLWYSLGFLI